MAKYVLLTENPKHLTAIARDPLTLLPKLTFVLCLKSM